MSLSKTPAFEELITKYKTGNLPATPIGTFQLSSDEGQVALIQKILNSDGAGWQPMAAKASLDSDYRVRLLGLALHDRFGSEDKVVLLVRGLFDNNGYVNKFAGNALVKVGPAAMPYLDALLMSEYEDAKFYAKQVKGLIDAQATAANSYQQP